VDDQHRRGRDVHEHRLRARRRARRRRLLALALLAACAAAAGAILALHPFSSSGRPRVAGAAPAPRPARHRAPRAAERPARRPRGPHDSPVPILMYHVIAVPPPGAPYPGLYVTPQAFEQQLGWLAAHGYHAVTLEQVYRYWRGLEALPAHPVVLSFDDGYRGDIVNALPVMIRHHWPGVLNLVVKNLGVNGGLYRRQVRRLIANGWELDAHTFTHPDLTTVGAAQLEREVAGSRRFLQRQFGVGVPFFCYPSGRFDDAVISAVKRAGYLGATTTEPGLGLPSQLYTLHRVRVDGSESLAAFVAALGGSATAPSTGAAG
jgi:peptidoglycan/xylan/chitin deacetylase (PgdA/CDA1 family)